MFDSSARSSGSRNSMDCRAAEMGPERFIEGVLLFRDNVTSGPMRDQAASRLDAHSLVVQDKPLMETAGQVARVIVSIKGIPDEVIELADRLSIGRSSGNQLVIADN